MIIAFGKTEEELRGLFQPYVDELLREVFAVIDADKVEGYDRPSVQWRFDGACHRMLLTVTRHLSEAARKQARHPRSG